MEVKRQRDLMIQQNVPEKKRRVMEKDRNLWELRVKCNQKLFQKIMRTKTSFRFYPGEEPTELTWTYKKTIPSSDENEETEEVFVTWMDVVESRMNFLVENLMKKIKKKMEREVDDVVVIKYHLLKTSLARQI